MHIYREREKSVSYPVRKYKVNNIIMDKRPGRRLTLKFIQL